MIFHQLKEDVKEIYIFEQCALKLNLQIDLTTTQQKKENNEKPKKIEHVERKNDEKPKPKPKKRIYKKYKEKNSSDEEEFADWKTRWEPDPPPPPKIDWSSPEMQAFIASRTIYFDKEGNQINK